MSNAARCWCVAPPTEVKSPPIYMVEPEITIVYTVPPDTWGFQLTGLPVDRSIAPRKGEAWESPEVSTRFWKSPPRYPIPPFSATVQTRASAPQVLLAEAPTAHAGV